jgi:hypothetical protein
LGGGGAHFGLQAGLQHFGLQHFGLGGGGVHFGLQTGLQHLGLQSFAHWAEVSVLCSLTCGLSRQR